jgi:hypothetical protein
LALAKRGSRVTIVGFNLFIIPIKNHDKVTIFFAIRNGMLSYRDENEAQKLMLSTIDSKEIDGGSPESRNYYETMKIIGSLRFSTIDSIRLCNSFCVCPMSYRTA